MKDIKVTTFKYSIENDKFDIKMFKSMLDNDWDFASIHLLGTQKYKQFKELQQDIFCSLYKYNPQMIPIKNLEYEYYLNLQIMNFLTKMSKYKELRALTKLDLVLSTIATKILSREILEIIDELKKNFEKDLKLFKAAQASLKIAHPAGLTLKEAQSVLEKNKKRLCNQIHKSTERQINKFLDVVTTKTIEASNLILNWGLQQDSIYTKGGYQEKIKTLEIIRNSKKLKKIAKFIGKYKSLAIGAQKEKIQKGINSVYDIACGDNIGRLIPTEIVKLSHPTLRKTFIKSFTEANLFQYEYIGTEESSAGAIVCCLDESGSMGGMPEIWAKALVLGLLEIAKRQKRDMHIIHFSSTWANRGEKPVLKTHTFKRNEAFNIDKILDMCGFFAGGGTLFEPPLNEARTYIETQLSYNKADIVFITDGGSTVTNDWLLDFNNWKKTNNVKVHAVLINVFYNTDVSLKLFANKIDKLDTLLIEQFDQVALSVFKNI